MNEDIDGEIQLLSQTGPFVLPVKCLTKRCLVSLEKTHLDFGNVYLGETLRLRVIVYNAGALAAEYTVSAIQGEEPQKAPPPPGPPGEVTHTLTTEVVPVGDDLTPDQSKAKLSDRSNYSIMSNVEIFRGSASVLGVIPADSANRLKSKSVGQITYASSADRIPPVELEPGKDPGVTDKVMQPGLPRPESKSAPGGSRSEIHPIDAATPTPKSRGDTPSISLQGDISAPVTDSQAVVGTGQDTQILGDTSSKMLASGMYVRIMIIYSFGL